jgi:hypothetical protein
MRKSRTYGSGGACDETHVPTATTATFHHAAWQRRGPAARGARPRKRASRAWACLVRPSVLTVQTAYPSFLAELRKLGFEHCETT